MDIRQELKNIEIENIIWVIYLLIIGANFVSNYYVERYLFTKDPSIKKLYRTINIIVLSIAIAIYIYYVYFSYKKAKKNTGITSYLILIASILILIGGILYLYVEIKKSVTPDISIV